MDPPPDFSGSSLDALARIAAGQSAPPVERWSPAHCGDSAMRIAADGRWFHHGAPIERPEMVRLFSSILWREADGGFVLVTPVEKLSIAVDDAPFVAVEIKIEGGGAAMRMAFRLNTGDVVVAGPAHPIRVATGASGPRPYLSVRNGLDALIGRTAFYELAAHAVVGPRGAAGVWSDGAFFDLDPA